MEKGQVYKGVGGIYDVKLLDSRKFVKAIGRGNLKLNDEKIYIGDYVDVRIEEKSYSAIEKIHARTNFLIRPYVSNISSVLIFIAPVPEPNYVLIDKQIASAIKNKIQPYLVINKSDLKKSQELYKYVLNEYKNVLPVYLISSLNNQGMESLLKELKDKTVALAGQSAVGKSSFINAIMQKEMCVVGNLSAKTQRGKNTTRHIEIIDVDKHGFKIIDTCGFSSFEINDTIKAIELKNYYPDFKFVSQSCKFRECVHINEPECAVKAEVEKNQISKNRYQRYVKIYNELKDGRWKYE